MNRRQWTPGPWRMLRDDTGGEFTGWPSIEALPAADLTIIHRAGFKQEFWGDLSQREAIANARLISAAPEEDNALLTAVMWWEDIEKLMMQSGRPVSFGTNYKPSWFEPALAALTKARGG